MEQALKLAILVLAVAICAVNARPPSKPGNCFTTPGEEIQNGEVFRVFKNSNCMISRCVNGNIEKIRQECTDSYRRCHPEGSEWNQGCRRYRCNIEEYTDAFGNSWTKYEPVKIADCL